MSHGALGRQFDPSQVGPAAARHDYQAERGLLGGRSQESIRKRRVEGHPQQLFPTEGSSYMLEPHQQTRSQFAEDPRTWWHGRHGEQLPTKSGDARNAGIHFGTLASAHQRKQKLGPSRKWQKSGDPQHYKFFPVRLTGQTSNTPRSAGFDEGQVWNHRPGIHYYQNEVEDSGSISAKVPHRQSVMTHGDFLKQAKNEGKTVHPNILWESRQFGRAQYDPGQKTGEEILDHRRKSLGLRPQDVYPTHPRLDMEDKYDRHGMMRRQENLESEALTEINRRKSQKTMDAMGIGEDQDLVAMHANLRNKYPHLFKD